MEGNQPYRERLYTESPLHPATSLPNALTSTDPGLANPNGVIGKDEFKKLHVDDLELYVAGYSHGILSHTEYEVQISVQNKYFY